MSSIPERFKGFFTLSKDVNKVKDDRLETDDGIVSELIPELTITTGDEVLIQQKKKWQRKWDEHNIELKKRQDVAEKYWLGEQHESFVDVENLGNTFRTVPGDHEKFHHLHDNLIFESLETYLPQATRMNPEPVVMSDNTEEGIALSNNLRKMLIYLADILHLRLKIKTAARSWALYLLGVLKVGWDVENDEIALVSVRPQRLILDPDATITEGGVYTGSYIGETRRATADSLAKRFPKKKEFISAFVQGEMGTQIQYIEWWAERGRILFWTLKDEVLGKVLNPHWNYEENDEENDTDEFGEEDVERIGIEEPLEDTIARQTDNHFPVPQFPYIFLSVFNLGMNPHDNTSLIEQNIGNQDLINKRYRQIDCNVDGINGGWAISGERSGIDKEQASGVISAFRRGAGVWVPKGAVSDAVQRMQGSGLPPDVFNQLVDARNQLRQIFGVQGSTPEGIKSEQTVRGKILIVGQDQSRIGGGVSQYIEQVADRVYNWFVQLMYVYYDEQHVASIIGEDKAVETVSIQNTDFDRRLRVSVKEGSMIPKDPLTQANQAIDLFGAGAISPLELHRRLDSPDPQRIVDELVQFQTDPQGLTGGAEPPQAVPAPNEVDLLDTIPIP